jgi:hypothetical protein
MRSAQALAAVLNETQTNDRQTQRSRLDASPWDQRVTPFFIEQPFVIDMVYVCP